VTATVLLVRHGRTAWNAQRRFQGQLDPPLDEVGVAQAAAVAPVLAALEPVALLCSDLQRARDTAAPLAAMTGLLVAPDARLREIALGEWQGLTRAEAAERFPVEHEEWTLGRDVRRGGSTGETYAEVGRRAVACLDDALDSAGEGLVVAVTHGGTARAVIGTLLGLPRDLWSRIGPLGNCRSVVLRRGETAGWRLAEHNSDAPERRL